jgi:hypothetical protein
VAAVVGDEAEEFSGEVLAGGELAAVAFEAWLDPFSSTRWIFRDGGGLLVEFGKELDERGRFVRWMIFPVTVPVAMSSPRPGSHHTYFAASIGNFLTGDAYPGDHVLAPMLHCATTHPLPEAGERELRHRRTEAGRGTRTSSGRAGPGRTARRRHVGCSCTGARWVPGACRCLGERSDPPAARSIRQLNWRPFRLTSSSVEDARSSHGNPQRT